VRVGIRYDPSAVSNPNNLKLFHWEGGHWVDVTDHVDTANDIVYGVVTSLSPFFVGEPMPEPAPPSLPIPSFKTTISRIWASTITVTSPNGGENWMVGTFQTITWTSDGRDDQVKIILSRDGATTWETIVSSIRNDGNHRWKLTGPAATDVLIRVVSTKNEDVMDVSDANFTIVMPTITISPDSPNGGEDWGIGTRQTITWMSDGVTSLVRIDLSRDGGNTWRNIIPYTKNDGQYIWRVTGPATNEATIRVSTTSRAVFDVSDADFTISGS